MACGCNRCNQRREERNSGCIQQYDNFLDIFEREERCTGPYTWNGYVWYDMEVTYNGPFFGSRRPEPRNCGCGNRNCGCGCNR